MIKKLQTGFSLVTAIFLLVVLGGLGAVMMTFFAAQQQSSALDVMGSRAYQAARAGIEWGAYQVLQNSGGPFVTGTCAGGPAQIWAPGTTLAGSTLSDFNVTIACTAFPYTESGNFNLYQLTSTASYGAAGQPDFVEREIQATIGQ